MGGIVREDMWRHLSGEFIGREITKDIRINLEYRGQCVYHEVQHADKFVEASENRFLACLYLFCFLVLLLAR